MTYHAVVKREDADISTVVDVVSAHDRVGVIFYPNAGQGVPTDLIVLINALENTSVGVGLID